MAEEIDLEMCNNGQLSEVQMFRDLDLDLGSGKGHIIIHSTCSTTRMPNHVTVASGSLQTHLHTNTLTDSCHQSTDRHTDIQNHYTQYLHSRDVLTHNTPTDSCDHSTDT